MSNILFVETGTFGGGSFESLYLLIKYLDGEKYSPIILFLNETKYTHKIAELGIPYYIVKDHLYTLRGNRLLKMARLLDAVFNRYFVLLSLAWEFIIHYSAMKDISEIIQKHNIKLIHGNDHINRDFFCNFLAKKFNLVLISHIRTFSLSGFNRFKSSYSNKIVYQYIAISKSIKAAWIEKGLKKDKIEIIHNGIEMIERDPINLNEKFGYPKQDVKWLGAVGTYNSQRGYEFLLKTIFLLISRNDKIRLIFIGNENHKNLLKLTRELNLDKYIIFIEHVERAIDYIAGMDLMIIPYSVEPFGRTLLETWMMKTPVIITDTDYIRDVVEADKTCILVPYGRIEILANEIENILADSHRSRQMTEYAYEFVKKRYHVDRYVNQIEDIYNKALHNAGKRNALNDELYD